MYTSDDILEAARIIRLYLSDLLEVEEAKIVDLALAELLTRAESGEAVDNQILELLAERDATREWTRQFLIHKMPLPVTRGYDLKGYDPLAGSISVIDSNVFVCPVPDCSRVWYRPRVGIEPPFCQEHKIPLVPAQPKDQSKKESKEICYIHAEMDEQVIINRVTTVEVALSHELLTPTQSKTSQTTTAEIIPTKQLLVQIIPKTNFVIVGEDRVEIDPQTFESSRQLYFDLRATSLGEGEVWVVVRQGQIPLNTLKLKPQIVQSRSELTAIQKTSIDSSVSAPSNFNEPPHQLCILERRNGTQIFYQYELRSPSLNILKSCESKPIPSERYGYVESLYKEIENRWLNDADAFSAELRAFGGQLFDQLFPQELQQILWEHRHTINSIMVLSTEPFIPWELVHLKPPGQNRLPDETRFLGQMGLVRWLYDAGWPPELIQIRKQRVFYIIPHYPVPKYKLLQAEQENQFLEEKFQATPIEPQPNSVRDLISKAGKFDLLHFAGHGFVEQDNIASSKLMLEGRIENNVYVPAYLSSITVEQYSKLDADGNRPMIVLNACQVGRGNYALTGMSGFAQAFLRGGAGAFVGPLWSVGDRPARIFTETLYTELLEGRNLSEATVIARDEAQKAGDATWLAYSVYGHPSLQIVQS